MKNRLIIFIILGFINTTLLAHTPLIPKHTETNQKYLDMHYDNDASDHLIRKVERTYPRDIRMLAQGLHVQASDFKTYFRYTVNVQTPGYKKTKVAKVHTGNDLTARQYIVWQKDVPVFTDRGLDLYVTGKKTFFTLKAPNGEELYTHDGRFTLGPKNQLVTVAHMLPVMGENGPIFLEDDGVVIDDAGHIKHRNEIVDKLKITTFSSTDGLWAYEGTLIYILDPKKTSIIENDHYFIKQGYFEASNEHPGYFSSKLMVPWFETTAASTKKYLEAYEKLFEAVEVKTNE